MLGAVVVFVHRTGHVGRLWRGSLGDPSPTAERHLVVYLLSLVGVDLAATVVLTLL